MSVPILEMDGTAEEIQSKLNDFAGQRLHVTVQQIEFPEVSTAAVPPQRPCITEKILARTSAIPATEIAKMPTDLAEQHDHYVYGWPKK